MPVHSSQTPCVTHLPFSNAGTPGAEAKAGNVTARAPSCMPSKSGAPGASGQAAATMRPPAGAAARAPAATR